MRACSERWLASQPAAGAAPPLVFARRMKATVLNRPAFATTSPTTAEPSRASTSARQNECRAVARVHRTGSPQVL
jgi:hypothetical protein